MTPVPVVVAVVELIFRTLAGSTSGGGFRDGTGEAARFSAPRDVTVCRNGDIYVADTGNNAIRKVTAAGVVSTVATGFNAPTGIASDADCNVYVADSRNNVVKRISGGIVTTFASGLNDPHDVAFGPNGVLYVADTGNRAIRAVSPTGTVTTHASGFQAPRSLAVDAAGVIYVADFGNFSLFRVSPQGAVTSASSTSIGDTNLAVADDGTVYLSDSNVGVIRRLAAGLPIVAGVSGGLDLLDGPVASAHFRGPMGLAIAGTGKFIVSEVGNETIRVIENGEVRRLAGSAPEPGTADGPGEEARFRFPTGLTISRTGTLYVGDQNSMRTVSPAGVVSTFARGSFAKSFPAVDASGNVFTSSFGEHVIYKTTPTGTTTVFAGTIGAGGLVDGRGTAARLQSPRGLAVGTDGAVYVGDAGNGAIRRITPDGDVTTVKRDAGGPTNLVIDSDDTLYYIGEANPAVLRQLKRDGTLTTLAAFNDYSTLYEPRLARAPDGTFYTVDVNTDAVRRIVGNGTEVVAGVDQGPGNENGGGAAARFDLPREIAFSPDGRLYLTDAGNHAIRVGQLGESLSVISFTATPPRIGAGAAATLRWETNGARSARIDPGVGEVPVNGTMTVSPSQTTTYVLTMRGDSGEKTASVLVAVGPAPPRRRAVK